MNNYGNPKSATTAGLLGIFLGSVGAHCWYLGDKKKGIIHVSLCGGAILLEILASAVLPAIFASSFSYSALTLVPVFAAIGGLVAAGNGIWGLVEGITILAQGDEGLARKGYPVAAPQQPYYGQQPQYGGQPQYNQPYNPGYAQPQYGQQPYAQPAQPQAPTDPASQAAPVEQPTDQTGVQNEQ